MERQWSFWDGDAGSWTLMSYEIFYEFGNGEMDCQLGGRDALNHLELRCYPLQPNAANVMAVHTVFFLYVLQLHIIVLYHQM